MKFKKGDVAVYPKYGVGTVDEIISKKVGSTEIDCYVISIADTGSRVFVPVSTAHKTGLRTLSDKDAVKDAYRNFQRDSNAGLLRMNWNRRYKHLQEKLISGKVDDIVNVISDLTYLKNKKGLSFGEKQLLSEAEEIITSEFSIVENISKDEVREKIYKKISF
ncbi:MAG: CarD family transcriptional regulator [bacterium]